MYLSLNKRSCELNGGPPAWRMCAPTLLLILLSLWSGDSYSTSHPSRFVNCDELLANLQLDIRENADSRVRKSARCADGMLYLDYGQVSAATVLNIDSLTDIVREPFSFFGLAGFYNGTNEFILTEDGRLSPLSASGTLSGEEWFVTAGRFFVLGLAAPGATLSAADDAIFLEWPANSRVDLRLLFAYKQNASAVEHEFDSVRYHHLWQWLATLAKFVESALQGIHTLFGFGWGWTIFIFAILLKILLIPVGILTVRLQRTVSAQQAKLEPQLAQIKDQFDGEEAHRRIMQAHRDLGVTPFYTLKPMLGTCIQIPILIAVFNALGEMPQMIGEEILWVKDLAYPDSIGTLSTAIPFMGSTISLLPVVMTLVSLLATVSYENRLASPKAASAQRRQLYVMAGAFFVLFYAFPAAMVLYWTIANALQFVQQKILKI